MRWFLLFFSLLIISCSSRSQPNPPLPTMMDSTLSKDIRKVENDSVVFVGDSLTHMGWWRKLFPQIKTANQGIGGNTTLMVLARLDPIIEMKPKKLFLLVGANDINFGMSDQQITAVYSKIISRIREVSPDTIIYCTSIFPFGAKVREYFPQVPKDYKTRIISLNKAIALISFQQGANYLNLYDSLSDGNNNLRSDLTKDQLHLEPNGYFYWVELIEKQVKE